MTRPTIASAVGRATLAPAFVAATLALTLAATACKKHPLGWFAIDIEGQQKRATPRLEGVTGRVYEKDGILMTVVSHVENKKTVTGFGIAGVPQREETTADH